MKCEKCLLLKKKNAASHTSVQENSILILYGLIFPYLINNLMIREKFFSIYCLTINDFLLLTTSKITAAIRTAPFTTF
ncbi:hypothetical protein SAMN05443270_1938 [Lacrimispora sphenoides]|jgi:hypothetical protein|nr:hypothetical protein SAMN05443270_1938 [Lacrimispora sphenoides]